MYKGNARRKLKSTQVQAMVNTIQKRITSDESLTTDQLISLSNAAVELAQTLNAMDQALPVQRRKSAPMICSPSGLPHQVASSCAHSNARH
jgi:hypothetical protein